MDDARLSAVEYQPQVGGQCGRSVELGVPRRAVEVEERGHSRIELCGQVFEPIAQSADSFSSRGLFQGVRLVQEQESTCTSSKRTTRPSG